MKFTNPMKSGYSQIVDAIFGFSFYPEGGIRAPFDQLINDLSDCNVQILSVDVPSGWNVDSGPVFEKSKCKKIQTTGRGRSTADHGRVTTVFSASKTFSGINPAINLSLSAPKHCLKQFSGENYLGGRFLPDEIKKEFNLSLPDYPDQEQIVKFDKTQIDFSAE